MEWISVKDKMPEEGVPVLSFGREEIRVDYVVKFEEGEPPFAWACRRCDESLDVTHWMPLPSQPKIEKAKQDEEKIFNKKQNIN